MNDLSKNLHWVESERQRLEREIAELKKEHEKLVAVVRCAMRAVDTDFDETDVESLEFALEPFQKVMSWHC